MSLILPPKTIVLWQIRTTLLFLSFCGAFVVFGLYMRFFLMIAAVSAMVGLGIVVIYIPLYFKSFRILIDENAIIITKGLAFKTTRVMPFPRFLFAMCITTPLSETMRLKCVLLKAARCWMVVPELEFEVADNLINALRKTPND